MRLFVDESLSPRLAIRLNESGHHDATHPLLSGGLGEPDHRVLARCLTEDRVLVTQNARDFRKLVRGTDLHPGLVILPSGSRDQSIQWLDQAIAYLEARGEPMPEMVNSVLEITADGGISISALP